MKSKSQVYKLIILLLTALTLIITIFLIIIFNKNLIISNFMNNDYITLISFPIILLWLIINIIMYIKQKEKKVIFLSYCEEDKIIAEQIINTFKRAKGMNKPYILSNIEISYGDNLNNAIKHSIEKSNIFVNIITKNYSNSQWCKKEFETAFIMNKLIIPIWINSTNYDGDYKYLLKDTKGIILKENDNEKEIEKQIQTLINELK